MTTETNDGKVIRKFRVKELNSLEKQNYYAITPCDEPTCIYKLIENSDKVQMLLYTGNRNYTSWLSKNDTYSKVRVEMILPSENRWQSQNIQSYIDRGNEIHVLIDDNPAITVNNDASNNEWERFIDVGGLPIKLSMSKIPFEMVEEDGKFSARAFGCIFPASYFLSKKSKSAEKRDEYFILSSLNAFPVKITDSAQRARFIEKIMNETGAIVERTITGGDGIKKMLVQIDPFLKNEKDIFSVMAFKIAAENSKKTIANVKFSVALNKLFENVTTQEQFSNQTKLMADKLIENQGWHYIQKYLELLLDSLDEARDIKKAALKRKSTGSFNKIMDDLDFVKIDEAKYPLTHAAVYGGELPLGTFFRKSGESYFIFNDNWELWEEMLTVYPEEAKLLAGTCSGRTTYEKDLMSYFYFVLHTLPEYLEAHTGHKWTGIPKLVSSSNELDPPKEGESGTAKTRSALTPIVDNKKHTITIPYVSMYVSGGYGGTYCYGLDYNVLRKGLSFKGNAITRDVETKLNGRDDYGLMFYTLTGTAQGRGYPTFLIIFEKLTNSTKVHFHRVHPVRSKDGEYNSFHNWTISCYKWMIGNVNFERIKAQQGDLAFVEIDKFPDGEHSFVNSYDHHCFGEGVLFTPYVKKEKQNILGYVSLPKDTELSHNEHMNRIIPAGNYEIRQCRSWEANPKGVWSLRID